MKLLLPVVMLLLIGCIAQPIQQADTAVKERIEQVEKVLDDKVHSVQSSLEKTTISVDGLSKRWEDLFRKQSEDWQKQSDQWRAEADKLEAESASWRGQSDLWRKTVEDQAKAFRDQSDMWRSAFQTEAEKTRLFITSERKESLEQLKVIVDGLPAIVQKSTAEAIGTTGVKMTTDPSGKSTVDWTATIAAIAAGGIAAMQTLGNRKQKKEAEKKHVHLESRMCKLEGKE